MKRIVYICTLLLLSAGCRTVTEYVPVAAVSTEHLDHEVRINDRITSRTNETLNQLALRDTRVTVNDNGDTLRTDTRIGYVRDRSVERENDSLRQIIDSLRCVRRDSVPAPYPVERQLSRWEQTKQDWGRYAITCVAVVVCVAVAWIARKAGCR